MNLNSGMHIINGDTAAMFLSLAPVLAVPSYACGTVSHWMNVYKYRSVISSMTRITIAMTSLIQIVRNAPGLAFTKEYRTFMFGFPCQIGELYIQSLSSSKWGVGP